MWRALTGTMWSPHVPLSRRPFERIVSTCCGHWSMSVTSCPALVSMPPTTLPMAPAPMIPIRVPIGPLLWPEHDNLNRDDLRLRSADRSARHPQRQVAEVRPRRPPALDLRPALPVARARDPRAPRAGRARRVRLSRLRAARVPRAVRRPPAQALQLAPLPWRRRADPRRVPRGQRG